MASYDAPPLEHLGSADDPGDPARFDGFGCADDEGTHCWEAGAHDADADFDHRPYVCGNVVIWYFLLAMIIVGVAIDVIIRKHKLDVEGLEGYNADINNPSYLNRRRIYFKCITILKVVCGDYEEKDKTYSLHLPFAVSIEGHDRC